MVGRKNTGYNVITIFKTAFNTIYTTKRSDILKNLYIFTFFCLKMWETCLFTPNDLIKKNKTMVIETVRGLYPNTTLHQNKVLS